MRPSLHHFILSGANYNAFQDFNLYLIAFVVPTILIPIIDVITVRSWHDLHNGKSAVILSLMLNIMTHQAGWDVRPTLLFSKLLLTDNPQWLLALGQPVR